MALKKLFLGYLHVFTLYADSKTIKKPVGCLDTLLLVMQAQLPAQE